MTRPFRKQNGRQKDRAANFFTDLEYDGTKTMSLEMANTQKTVIVTGGSQGIGAGVVKTFLDRDYSVVANRGASPHRVPSRYRID
jgi:hypothetical protein